MPEWLQNIAGPDYAAAVLWTAGALILLIAVLVIIRLVRGMTFGTFVSGGRNRKTRLAVMDATAIDSHRRLVLIRRDDVEHLILIGGPTDVVVEQNIRIGQVRRPALTGEQPQETAPRQQPRPVEQQRQVEQPRPVEPRPAPPQIRPPAPPQAPRDQRPAARPQERETAYAPQPPRVSQPPQPAAPPQPPRVPAPRPEQPVPTTRDSYLPRDLQGSTPPRDTAGDDIDRALLDELSTSLDSEPQQAGKPTPVTLEDEMNKLLGELSNHKK